MSITLAKSKNTLKNTDRVLSFFFGGGGGGWGPGGVKYYLFFACVAN